MALTRPGRQHSNRQSPHPELNRRRLLKMFPMRLRRRHPVLYRTRHHGSVTVGYRDGWAGVDIWTLPGDKFGCSGACWRAGVGSWIAFDDGRSYSNAVLEVMGAPRR